MLVSNRAIVVQSAQLFCHENKTQSRHTILAQLALHLCDSAKQKKSACGYCQDCLWLANDEHPDVLLLGGDERAITVDEVRQAQRFVELNANRKRGRWVVLWSADQMTVQAANALLKILEEPPAHSHLILEVRHGDRLLPTIRSRLVRMPISKSMQADESAVPLSQLIKRYRDGQWGDDIDDSEAKKIYKTLLGDWLFQPSWVLAAQRLVDLTWPVCQRAAGQLIEDALRYQSVACVPEPWRSDEWQADFQRFATALPVYAWGQLWDAWLEQAERMRAGVKPHAFSACYQMVAKSRIWLQASQS